MIHSRRHGGVATTIRCFSNLIVGVRGSGKTYDIATKLSQDNSIIALVPNARSFNELEIQSDLLIPIYNPSSSLPRIQTMEALSKEVILESSKNDDIVINRCDKKTLAVWFDSSFESSSNLSTKDLVWIIHQLALNGISPTEFDMKSDNCIEHKSLISDAYHHMLHNICEEHHVYDSSLLVLKALEYWKSNPKNILDWTNKYSHILVDDLHLMTPAMNSMLNLINSGNSSIVTAYSKNVSSGYTTTATWQKSHSVPADILLAARAMQNSTTISSNTNAVEYIVFDYAVQEYGGIASLALKEKQRGNSVLILCPSSDDCKKVCQELDTPYKFYNSDNLSGDGGLLKQKALQPLLYLLRWIHTSDVLFLYSCLDALDISKSEFIAATNDGSIPLSTAAIKSMNNPKVAKVFDIYEKFSSSSSTSSTSQFIYDILQEFNDLKKIEDDDESMMVFDQFLALIQRLEELPMSCHHHPSEVLPILFKHVDEFDIMFTNDDEYNEANRHHNSSPSITVARLSSKIAQYADVIIFGIMRDSKVPGRQRKPRINFFGSQTSNVEVADAMTYARSKVIFTTCENVSKPSRYLAPFSHLKTNHHNVNFSKTLPSFTNKTYKKKLGSPWISYSQMYEYKSCPYKYYLSRVLQLPKNQNLPMLYGKAMHEGVATFLATKSLEKSQQIFKTTLLQSNIIDNSYYRRGLEGLEDFSKRNYETKSPVAIEQLFCITTTNNVTLKGVWDHVTADFGIIEYKSNPSGRKRNVKAEASSSLQLQIYDAAFRSVYNRPPSSVTLEIIETGQRHTIITNNNDILEKVSQTYSKITQREFEPTPSFFSCNFCDYQTICRQRSSTHKPLVK